MADIIKLLPDAVANQIAAGEVVQRPASAVKELLENSVDSGATEVLLNVKDAGKTLIQVVDNGCGMSETDARMSFERHATSKIKDAEELWNIRTKGFRGEALASIAAIAQVEMKSRLHDLELGTKILVAGSKIELQEPCSTAAGTSISVKNLFFNTPARRNFLKSDPVEMRHIVEEFERVALAHPDVTFALVHNGNELFNLRTSALRQRIVAMMGGKYNERLVPVSEETAIVKVEGFIGKPEFARKTRGEQYFFVNHRFIKNPYLHHAVASAFDELIARDAHPTYYLYLQVDPSSIDVNIHPTKTEIKFAEERSVYAIIRSAVRNSLGKYNISPSLDFEQEDIFNVAPLPANTVIAPPETRYISYNPFANSQHHNQDKSQMALGTGTRPHVLSAKGWEQLYEITRPAEAQLAMPHGADDSEQDPTSERPVFQLARRYIVTRIKSGMIVLDQIRAMERIHYEHILATLTDKGADTQQMLFPVTVELNHADIEILHELGTDMAALGFVIDSLGGNTAVINGVPTYAVDMPIQPLLETFIEQHKLQNEKQVSGREEQLALQMARSIRVREPKMLQAVEMQNIIDRLFACEQPYYTPSGKPIVVTYSMEELEKKFKS